MINGIYAIIDLKLVHGDLCEAAGDIIEGGASIIQLRAKEASTKGFLEAGAEVRKVCRSKKIPFIINDRVDIALALDSDGVHLGQDDMPVNAARDILGSGKIIGLSVHSIEEARIANEENPDYIGAGSVFFTRTKTGVSPVGTELIRKIKKEIDMPVAAIGGINEGNIAEVISAGADAAAVCSAILSSDNIRVAVEELVSIWEKK